jgi:hypothetical protein
MAWRVLMTVNGEVEEAVMEFAGRGLGNHGEPQDVATGDVWACA